MGMSKQAVSLLVGAPEAKEVVDVERIALGEVQVEEAASDRWGACDQFAVARSVEDGGKVAKQRLEGGVAGGVALHMFVFSIERKAQQLHRFISHDLGFEEKKVRAQRNQLAKALGTEGPAGAEQDDRFEEIGLSLRIGSMKEVYLGVKF